MLYKNMGDSFKGRIYKGGGQAKRLADLGLFTKGN